MIGAEKEGGKVGRFLEAYGKRTIDYYRQPDNIDVCPENSGHEFLGRYVQPKDTVLEVGCGRGNYTFELARLARRVYAIDPIKRYVDEVEAETLRRKVRNVTLHTAGAESLGIIPGRYDRVFFGKSLSQLPSPRDALELARGRLKDGGSVIVTEYEVWPHPDGSFGPTHRSRAEAACSEAGCGMDEMEEELGIPLCINVPWLEKLAERAGLSIGRSERIGAPSGHDTDDVQRHFVAELGPKRR